MPHGEVLELLRVLEAALDTWEDGLERYSAYDDAVKALVQATVHETRL